MLRNVIVHIANEQPFMADLVGEPSPSDVCLICRNMRTMNGKKPVYVDFADSTFVVPISQIRFIEIPAKSYAEAAEEPDAPIAQAISAVRQGMATRSQPRGKRAKTGASVRAAATPPPAEPEPEADPVDPADPDTIVLLGSAYHDAELDNDLLRRIREA